MGTSRKIRVGVATAAAVALGIGLAGCGDTGVSVGTENVDTNTESGAENGSQAAPENAAAELVTLSSDWLANQVSDGLITNTMDMGKGPQSYTDYGLSVDVARTLIAVDQHPEVVAEIADAVSGEADSYLSPGFGTKTSAGAVAKLILLADETGADPTDFGGQDLVALLEDRTADSGLGAGRLSDEVDTKTQDAADYANVFVQAYAVQALSVAESPEAKPATEYLLSQQCSDGGFRQMLGEAEADKQACTDDPKATSDVDATAIAIIALDDQADDPKVGQALDKATGWLAQQQGEQGAFSESTGGVANTNTTGLAAQALASQDETDAAEQAAVLVARQRVANPGECSTFPEEMDGAIAYNFDAVAALSDGVDEGEELVQWRVAGAQALPALQWIPEETEELTVEEGTAKDSDQKQIQVSGLVDSDAVCISTASGNQFARPTDGVASIPMPETDEPMQVDVESVYGATVSEQLAH